MAPGRTNGIKVASRNTRRRKVRGDAGRTARRLSFGVTACDGNQQYRRGCKLHLDVADGHIAISGILTAASLHDSQVAIR